MQRTPIELLPTRRAPNLHRTLPTWAREPADGGVVYRVYAPHPDGGAMMSRVAIPAGTARTEAAARLRTARRFVWEASRAAQKSAALATADAGTPALEPLPEPKRAIRSAEPEVQTPHEPVTEPAQPEAQGALF